MPERYMLLNAGQQRDLLLLRASQTGRPAAVLEKDIWSTWALQVLFGAPLGQHLTFKGGTTLSKVHNVTKRLSKDLDLTWDVRDLLSDLQVSSEIPPNPSQAKRWRRAVEKRLPVRIREDIALAFEQIIREQELAVTQTIEADTLLLDYPTVLNRTESIDPHVLLEFGARSTGEPNQQVAITCYAAEGLEAVEFPRVVATVMSVHRTFWEKATAIHIFCLQGRFRGEVPGWSRHWFDLMRLWLTGIGRQAAQDKQTALAVACFKNLAFREKDRDGLFIDYTVAAKGGLRLVPDGNAWEALRVDFDRVLLPSLPEEERITFEELMDRCREIEACARRL